MQMAMSAKASFNRDWQWVKLRDASDENQTGDATPVELDPDAGWTEEHSFWWFDPFKYT